MERAAFSGEKTRPHSSPKARLNFVLRRRGCGWRRKSYLPFKLFELDERTFSVDLGSDAAVLDSQPRQRIPVTPVQLGELLDRDVEKNLIGPSVGHRVQITLLRQCGYHLINGRNVSCATQQCLYYSTFLHFCEYPQKWENPARGSPADSSG